MRRDEPMSLDDDETPARRRREEPPRGTHPLVWVGALGVVMFAAVAFISWVGSRQPQDRVASDLLAKPVDRASPQAVALKDFANFPADYAGKCISLRDVWIDGDLERVTKTGELSATVSADGSKTVLRSSSPHLRDGAVFVMPEAMGRKVAGDLDPDKKYRANLLCEVRRLGDGVVAKVYRLEVAGGKVYGE